MESLAEMNFKTILDVGCGEGSEINFLSKKLGARGLGIEPHKTAVKKLKRKYKENVKLNFVKGSASKLDLDDKSSELVILSSVLHWIEPSDYLRAISEVCRVSKSHLLIMDFFHFEPFRCPNVHHQGKFTYRRDFVDPVLSTGEFEEQVECYFRKSQDGTRWELFSEEELKTIQRSSVDFELRRAVLFRRVEMQIISHSLENQVEI